MLAVLSWGRVALLGITQRIIRASRRNILTNRRPKLQSEANPYGYQEHAGGCPRSWEGTDKLLKFPVIGLITVALGDGMLLTDCASTPLQPHGQPQCAPVAMTPNGHLRRRDHRVALRWLISLLSPAIPCLQRHARQHGFDDGYHALFRLRLDLDGSSDNRVHTL